MAGMLWVSDREPGILDLFAELLPEAEVFAPDELEARLGLGQRPDALIIDGTQLLELRAHQRADVLNLPRVLICTGIMLASMPIDLVSSPGVAVLAKPFCVEDLEAAVEWLRGGRIGGEPAVPEGALMGAGTGQRSPQSPMAG